jgi:DNA-binding GntR family transcriptional regulator
VRPDASGRIVEVGSCVPRSKHLHMPDTAVDSTFELIERVRLGDREAAERLMAGHVGPLR